MNGTSTYYDILNVSRNASPEVIKAAHKVLSHKYHPDRHNQDPKYNRIMTEINEAYQTLIDPKKRADYDRKLFEKEQRSGNEYTRTWARSEQNTTKTSSPPPKTKKKADFFIWKLILVFFVGIFLIYFVVNQPSGVSTSPTTKKYITKDMILGTRKNAGSPTPNNLRSLESAAGSGNVNAQMQLAKKYREGTGVKKDYSLAAYWYLKAAQNGNAMAQYNLGICYLNGIGVSKDYKKAAYWLRKAKNQGNKEAEKVVAKLEEYGY